MHNETLMQAGAGTAANRKRQSRALVPVSDMAGAQDNCDEDRGRGGGRFAGTHRQAGASAGFVTQLIACAGNLPAYRARRRAEPDEAARRYAGGPAVPPPRRGIAV
ncbi:MAG: hypothetical protein JJU21_15205 [Salinarimonas sp.]|nr:hypothetical protein [Salinarimonas sp.]